jgi:hypothetical protein
MLQDRLKLLYAGKNVSKIFPACFLIVALTGSVNATEAAPIKLKPLYSL